MQAGSEGGDPVVHVSLTGRAQLVHLVCPRDGEGVFVVQVANVGWDVLTVGQGDGPQGLVAQRALMVLVELQKRGAFLVNAEYAPIGLLRLLMALQKNELLLAPFVCS